MGGQWGLGDLLEGTNLIQWTLICLSAKSGGRVITTITCQVERLSDHPRTTHRPPEWQKIVRHIKRLSPLKRDC
jgi:hypothetical protein